MYVVKFKNVVPALELPSEPEIEINVADLERALAVASMLGKVSTPEVKFGDIKVEPFYIKEHETEKN